MGVITNFFKKVFSRSAEKVEMALHGEPIGRVKLSNGHCLFAYDPSDKHVEAVSLVMGQPNYKKKGWVYLYALNLKNAAKKLEKMGYSVNYIR